MEARRSGFGEGPVQAVMRQLLGFVFAGGVATVLNYLVFISLFELDVHVTVAATIGYVSGILVSFTINKLWVFSSSERSSLLRYSVAYGLALIAQLSLLNLLMLLGLMPQLANGVAIGLVVVVNYFLIRKFVFQK